VTSPTGVAADITVVIPTVGRPLLRDCLRSIGAADPRPAEVIVVDQSASDEVAAWVAALRAGGLPARHLPSRETGIANATNRGLEQARTPFVAVTHDDCRVSPAWLAPLLLPLRDGGDLIVTGKVEPAGEGAVPTVVLAPEPTVHTRPRLDGDDLFPPNMAFPRSLLDRIGYLDEHPSLRLAGEDNDWAYRALRAGIPIVYQPSSVVAHVAWQPAAALPGIYRRYARGQGAFYGKHLRRGDLFIARRLARDVLRAGWLALRASVSTNPELRALAYGEIGLLPGLLAGLRNPGTSARARHERTVHR
jgi:GT2 family glycosyltransferase